MGFVGGNEGMSFGNNIEFLRVFFLFVSHGQICFLGEVVYRMFINKSPFSLSLFLFLFCTEDSFAEVLSEMSAFVLFACFLSTD